MSDQCHDTKGVVTDLEDAFCLWEQRTGMSAAVATPGTRHDVQDSVLVDERDDPGHDDVACDDVARDDVAVGGAVQLEEVFLSDRFGEPASAGRNRREGARPEDTVVLPFPAAMDHARQRVIAAVSGVAAAALVVAGLSFGPGRHGGNESPSIAIQGPDVGTNAPPGTGAAAGSSRGPLGPGGSVAGGIAAGAVGNRASTHAVLTGEAPGGPPLGRATVPGPAGGSSALAIPATGTSGAGAGGAVRAPGPSPSPGAASAAAPASTGALSNASSAVANAVTNIDNSVTTTTNQLLSTAPVTTPVGGAVNGISATVRALGQVLGA